MAEDAAPSPLPGYLRWSGPLLSYCYGVGAGIHRALTTPQRANVPVISIGNISVGGTGKTPAAKYFARGLAQRGCKPAVLMRGYKNQASDEAREVELALAAEQIPVIVGSDRVANAAKAHVAGRNVVLLDDGFQHWRLARDLDIVLVDATNPFGGLLRENPAALARADVVLLTRSDLIDAEKLDAAEARVKALAPDALIARAVHAPVALTGLDGVSHQLAELRGRPVHALCGIGNPAAFQRTLRQLGAEVAAATQLPDHAVFSAAGFAALLQDRPCPVVVTEKDAVKLRAFCWDADVLCLKVEFKVLNHEPEIWARIEQAVARQ